MQDVSRTETTMVTSGKRCMEDLMGEALRDALGCTWCAGNRQSDTAESKGRSNR